MDHNLNKPSKFWQTNYSNHSKSSIEPSYRKLDFHKATKSSTSFKVDMIRSQAKNGTNGNINHKTNCYQTNAINTNTTNSNNTIESENMAALNPGLFDPKLLAPYITWKNISRVGPGLNNFGNTCYLNSTLQCLLYIPVLTQILLNSNESKLAFVGLNQSNDRMNKYVALQYQKFVIEVFRSGDRGSISPHDMVQSIRRVGKQFRPQRQEDAHEYLVQLLDCIHEEILKANQVKSTDGKIAETTIISRIFGGYFCNELKCPKCKYVSTSFNYFQSLSVDVLNGISTVKSAVEAFTKPENLSSGNEWNCEKCKQKVKATKQLRLTTLPQVLVIHLKRFSFGLGYGKISKHIRFELSIDIPCQNQNIKYDLCGIIVHHGNSVHSGHYVAFIKAPNGQWYEMNDGKVSVQSITNVLTQQAYILFYTRHPTEKIKSDTISTNVTTQSILVQISKKSSNSSVNSNTTNMYLTKQNNEGKEGIGLSKVLPKQDKNKLETMDRVSNGIQNNGKHLNQFISSSSSPSMISSNRGQVSSHSSELFDKKDDISTENDDDDDDDEENEANDNQIIPSTLRLKVIDSWKIGIPKFFPKRDFKFLFVTKKHRQPLRQYLQGKSCRIHFNEEEEEERKQVNVKHLSNGHSSIKENSNTVISTKSHHESFNGKLNGCMIKNSKNTNISSVIDTPVINHTYMHKKNGKNTKNVKEEGKEQEDENQRKSTQHHNDWSWTEKNNENNLIKPNKSQYGEIIRIIKEPSTNGHNHSTVLENMMKTHSKRGREPGSEGYWDLDNDDKDIDIITSAKSIVNNQISHEQMLLASRQASEWDKVLDQGRKKKIKVIDTSSEGSISLVENLFQRFHNKKNLENGRINK